MPGETHCDESHINGENGSPVSFVYWPRQTAQREDDTHCKGTMIRDKHFKYVCRSGENSDEFYDLEKDPGERVNAIGKLEYAPQIRRMQLQLLHWYQDTCDVVPLDFDDRFDKKMLFNMEKHNAQDDIEAELIRECINKGMNMAHLHGALEKFRGSH